MKRYCLEVGRFGRCALALGVVLCAGCFGGSGGSGGGAGESAVGGASPERDACQRVTSACPDVLSEYGLATATECEDAFNCVSGMYASISDCRAMLQDLYDCYAGISGSDCSACDAELDAVMQCPEPVGCIDTGSDSGSSS